MERHGKHLLVGLCIAVGAGVARADDSIVLVPTVSVTAPDATASEPGTDTGYFRISLGYIATAQSLTVNFTISGSATNGTDYQTISTPKTIPARSSYVDVPVVPIDDSPVEGDETVVPTLSRGSDYSPGTQDDDARFTVIGHVAGVSDLFFLEGRYAYVREGVNMRIIDVSNPSLPRLLGGVFVPGMCDISVSAGRAWIVETPWWSSESWVHIFDVRNPLEPVYLCSYEPTDYYGKFERICVTGNFAYVIMSGSYGRLLQIVDTRTSMTLGSYGIGSWGTTGSTRRDFRLPTIWLLLFRAVMAVARCRLSMYPTRGRLRRAVRARRTVSLWGGFLCLVILHTSRAKPAFSS